MKTKFVALCGLISMLAAGCAHKPLNENRPVVFMDDQVADCFDVANFAQSTMPDGRLHVVANLVNRAHHPLEAQVECVFKDAHGFSTGDETPWQTMIFTENGQETVSFSAMNSQAKQATIRVRRAR